MVRNPGIDEHDERAPPLSPPGCNSGDPFPLPAVTLRRFPPFSPTPFFPPRLGSGPQKSGSFLLFPILFRPLLIIKRKLAAQTVNNTRAKEM